MVHPIRPKKKLIGSQKVLIVALLCGAFFLFNLVWIYPARAAEITTAEQTGLTANEGFGQAALGKRDIVATVASIINIVLGVLGIIAVGLIVYAGFLWMTAAGNADQVAKAKMILRNAAIGLAIILASWGIAAFIISRLSSASGIGDTKECVGPDCPKPPHFGDDSDVDFSLEGFDTTRPIGNKSNDDVYVCSNIQSRFNNWLDKDSFYAARTDKKLTVFQIGVKDNQTAVEYKPIQEPKQILNDVIPMSNVVAFKLDHTGKEAFDDEWPEFSQMEVRVSQSLTNEAGKTLKVCRDCQGDKDGYFFWKFTTTNKRDTVPPILNSAYPRLNTAQEDAIEGYPDRNVDRSITFVLNFSEAVDFTSVGQEGGMLNKDNIIVEEIVSNINQTHVATTSESMIVSSADGGSIQFALNPNYQSKLNDGPNLEPYTWYRITVQNIRDLCGNPLAGGGKVQWIFQTNGNIPGVAFVYPADKYKFACPSTETFVQFRTSMYDIKTLKCNVNPTAGGLVTAGQGIDGRALQVKDDVPDGDNPNNFCKRYDFAPASQALSVNTEYKPEVSYRNPANDAQTEKVNWSFMVKPASQCANAPYISALSPPTGPWGRCLTIQGNYFANTPGGDGRDDNRRGSDARVKLKLDSIWNNIPLTADNPSKDIRNNWTSVDKYKNGLPLNVGVLNWFNTYLTGEMPNASSTARADGVLLVPPGTGGIVNFDFFVVREAGPPFGDLTSNLAGFAVLTNEEPYQGPCLYYLQPNVGKWQDPVVLRGIKFLPLNQKTKTTAENVFFNDNTLLANTDINGWQAEEIRTVVPNDASDGLVKVLTSAGLSNGIKFDVANGLGGPCRDTNDCTAPQICSAGRCVDPPRPAGFRIEQTNPTAACSAACKNAEVNLVTNMTMKFASAVKATFVGTTRQGDLDIRECLDDNCRSLSTHQAFTSGFVWGSSNKKLKFDFTLAAGKRYRVIVYGGPDGLLAADGKQLSNINYDADLNGENDSYSWYFTVGANDCAVDRIDTAPPSLGFYEGDPGEKVLGTAYGKPDSCSSEGQVLNVAAGFEWKSCKYTVGDIRSECVKTCTLAEVSSEKAIIGFAIDPTKPTENTVSAANGNTAGARALACLFYGAGAIKDATVVTVRSKCESDANCVSSGDNSCPGSTCNITGPNAGRCTPVISASSPSPASGAPGTWVTLNGCYFGNRPGEVKFNNSTPFGFPGGQCGSTWSDTQIIAEAPAEITGSGKLKVTENRVQDAQSAESAAAFTVDDTVRPGLCRVEPESGKVGASVKLIGRNFGNARNAADDAVKFTDAATAPRFATITAAIINGWKNDIIEAVVVPQIPLPGLKELWAAITVWKAANFSNPFDFHVIETPAGEPGTTAANLRVRGYQPGAGKLACLDMITEVTFDGLVDGNSLKLGRVSTTTPEKFFVRRFRGSNQGDYIPIDGEVWLDYPNNSSTTLSFLPDKPMSTSTNYQIVIKSGNNGLLSTTGGQLVTGGPCSDLTGDECVIGFTTISGTASEKAQCAAAGLNITPANPYFTCAGDGCADDFLPATAGYQRQFRATLEARNGQPLSPRGAEFIWETSDKNVIALADPSDTGRVATTTVGVRDGKSIVKATLQDTEIAGASQVTVFLCDNPWPAKGAGGLFAPYRDADNNFSIYYCRDRGQPKDPSDDLPELIGPISNTNRAGVPDLLKELFFQSTSTDAIGIRVLANFPHYSIGEWYNRQTFNKGSPSPLTIDGYQALRDGRTVYASAPNQSDAGNLYTNIYLLSYNDGAHPDTVNIANQMAENMSFAVNIANPLDKDKLRRDVKRWTDALILSGALFKETGPVKLQSGTFIAGKSVSVWPSWQDTLGKALGGRLPIDPVVNASGANIVKCSADYDQKTCFNKDKPSKFVCDAGSQAYFYRYEPGSPTASPPIPPKSILGFKLEYGSPDKWVDLDGGGLIAPWSEKTGDVCVNLEYRQEYE